MAVRKQQPWTIRLDLPSGPVEDMEIGVFKRLDLARAAWFAALRLYPNEPMLLMHGARVMRQHPERT